MKRLYLVCVCLLAVTQDVLGLQCLTTDMEKLREGKVEENVTECDDNFQGVFAVYRMVGRQTTKPFVEDMFRCYKMTVQGDRTFTLNGCMLKGGCALLAGLFEQLNSECKECEGNNCNALVEQH